MKVFLINTPYVDIYGPIKSAVGRYFPLGIGYIASFLQKYDHQVFLIDPEAQKQNSKDIERLLKREKPEVVGISCATPNFPEAVKLSKYIKTVLPETKVVLGGAHASALPKFILEEYKSFDFTVKGEGEYTMLELLEKLEKGKIPSDTKGLALRINGTVKENTPREWIKDVDNLPFPARDLLPPELYRPHAYMTRKKESAAMISTRGCPNRCSFCASNLTLGRTYRPHSPEYTFTEISTIVKDFGIKQILFHDDTFTISQNRVEDLCRLIIRHKLDIVWSCFARVNTVNRDLLKIMKEAGCFSLSFGIESGDEDILREMQKDISLKKAEKALKLSHELGFKTLGFFIFGTKGETKASIEKTINFSIKLSPTIAFFNILVPYPGTKVFNDLGYSYKKIKNWKDYVAVGIKPTLITDDLSKLDLTRSVKNAYLRFYLRLSQTIKMLKGIKSKYELLEYVRGGIGLLEQMKYLK